MEIWIERFGTLAVFIGTFLEGETILILAGVLAHAGRLHLPGVITAAFFGSWTGHLVWFEVGRRRGPALLEHKPALRGGFDRVEGLIARFGVLTLFVTQYLYGTRLTSAVAFGMSRMSRLRFALLQVPNCLVWSVVVATLGYVFGEAAARALGRAAHYEKIALAVVGAGALVIFAVRRVMRDSKRRHDAD